MNIKRLEMIRNIRLELSGVKINKFEEGIMENPCQPGYIAYGTKEKDGAIVPNCIPDPEEMKKIIKEGFPIPSPSGSEDKDTFVSRCISEISSEYEQDQAIAICIGKWEER